MEMRTISTTDLASHILGVLDAVADRGETVNIERNHTVIAQIVPPETIMTARQALATLDFPMLTPKEGKVWLEDSKDSFSDEVCDPWA
jgi:antitoxin (DNA-binding transcriptional repressor) of toxin-antitoxin stability system